MMRKSLHQRQLEAETGKHHSHQTSCYFIMQNEDSILSFLVFLSVDRLDIKIMRPYLTLLAFF